MVIPLLRSIPLAIFTILGLPACVWGQLAGSSFQPLPSVPVDSRTNASLALPPPPFRSDTKVSPASFVQPAPEPPEAAVAETRLRADDFMADRFARSMTNTSQGERFDVGVDLYSAPDFSGGLVIYGDDVAMKIGGFVKADFIYDFNPIDNTDSFDTTTIPVGAAPRTNSRYHARQTRLSFDTFWTANQRTVRIFVEGDFFSDSDRYRLRHAYGESGPLLVGQTWTTFTDVAAAPATLDFEGSVSNVNRRQAQARWTESLLDEDITWAVAIEDSREIFKLPAGLAGDLRTPSPDFVARIRLERDWGQFQVAGLYRVLGFQPEDSDMLTGNGWGLNFTNVFLLTDDSKVYSQIVFGEGIGSYRSLPDAVPAGLTSLTTLPILGWMIGVTHDWTDAFSSNFTYAENRLFNTDFQDADDVRRTTYLAANLIWNPLDRVRVGVEYLYGLRENVDLRSAAANRLQLAFIFDLP